MLAVIEQLMEGGLLITQGLIGVVATVAVLIGIGGAKDALPDAEGTSNSKRAKRQASAIHGATPNEPFEPR